MVGRPAKGKVEAYDEKAPAKVNSVRKTLQILESICRAKNGLSSSNLAKAHGMSSPLVHHYLKGLIEEGYVSQAKRTKLYMARFRIVELGNIVFSNNEITELSHSILSALSESTKSVIHLALREGDLGVCVSKIGNSEAVPSITRIGMSFDLYATALGKAMLAFFDPNEIKDYLARTELIPYSKNTITDPKALMKELEKIRSQHYAFDNEEHRLGLKAIGVPVFDYTDSVIGAISYSLMPFHTQDYVRSTLPLMNQAAREVSEEIGCKDYSRLM